eukprot:XP_003723801.1 PREDICTED: uncharacterized protein LOC100888632 [Strongylocentrotus purpuratus]
MGCGGSKSTAVVESNVDVRRHNGIKRSNDVINERATVDESRGYTEQNSGNVTEGQSVKVNEEIAHPLKHKNVINGHTTGIDDGVVINQQRDEPDSIERKSKQNVRQSAPYKIPTDPKTVSPFDPSVNVAKYREEPIPVFGRAAFPLSKDTPDLKIEDTFWPGKRALIPDYNQMKKLDKHAIETPPGLRKDMDQLVAHLTTVANSELEKLRVIFRWVAHNTEYNVEGFRTGMYGDNSAEAVLRTGLAVCGGYSNLMVAMCAKAGVECVKITGYAKGSGYWPGKENLSKMTHAWNRVTLNGSTFLCDCTWAAGSVDTAFTRHWKEGQFLAEPKSFANHHFPKGVDIQKIFSTQSLEDWNNTPVLGALAQFSGLECVSHKEGIIKAPSNSCLIKLKLERALYNTFCIVKNEDGTKLKGVALQWWNKNELSCSIRLPKAGRYSFVLIGKISWQRNDNGNTEVLYPEQPSDAIRNTIVSYVIKATGGEKLDPMSTEEINLYGAPLNLPDYGLTPADKNEATVQAVAGSAHVVFKKLHEGPSSVRVDVCKVGDQNKKMESSVYCEHFDDWVVCHVRCPSAGKYTLTMYVKSDHEDYSCRLTYIIVCTGKFDPIRLPDMSRVSGPNAKFAGLGLRLRDTLTSTIVTVEGEGQLVITCDTTKEMKIIAGLKDISESPNNDGDYVVETNKTETEQVTTVSLRLKTKGFFKLTLFAKPKTESVPTPKNEFVGQWLVCCRKPSKKEPFPKGATDVGPKAKFHSLGLQTATQSRVVCENGEGTFEVFSRPESSVEFRFNLKIGLEEDEVKRQVFADTYVMETKRITRFHFRMDKTGTFAFRLFAKSEGSEKHDYVGIWLVVNEKVCKKPTYPGRKTTYGPKSIFWDSGLGLDDGVSKRLDLSDGEGELCFTHKPGTNRRITAHLETAEGGRKDKSSSVTSSLIEAGWSDEGEITSTRIRLRVKKPGIYDLVVFTEDETGKSNAGVWLADCAKATTKAMFPDVRGTKGPDPQFFQMGLSTKAPHCSTLPADADGLCTLTVLRDKPFSVIFQAEDSRCKISKTKSETGKPSFTCDVKLPSPGLYTLSVFAADSEPKARKHDFVGRWLMEWHKK